MRLSRSVAPCGTVWLPYQRRWLMRTTCLLLVLAVALPLAASADILFTTGPPQSFMGGWLGWGSYYNSNQKNNIFARPFSISEPLGANLEEIHFWSLFVAPAHPIQFDLYDADGTGQPTQLMESWFISQQDIVNGALFHIDEPGQPTDGLKVGWRLPAPVTLSPDKYYALAIYGVGAPDGSPRPIYWMVNTSASDQGPLSYVTQNGGITWVQFDPGAVGLGDQFGRNALELVGSPVPEPITLVLTSLGLVSMAGLLRRRK
jgi:hypothetical protein